MRNSVEEYQVRKSELNMRFDKMYTNNYAIITLMFAAWTIITSMYINNESKFLGIIVALLPILLAIITTVLLSQWNENRTGIGKNGLGQKISEIQSKDKNYLVLKEFLNSKIAQQ